MKEYRCNLERNFELTLDRHLYGPIHVIIRDLSHEGLVIIQSINTRSHCGSES